MILVLSYYSFLPGLERQASFCPFLTLFIEVSCPLVNSKSMWAKRRNQAMETHGKF